jgi:hypothetical protein
VSRHALAAVTELTTAFEPRSETMQDDHFVPKRPFRQHCRDVSDAKVQVPHIISDVWFECREDVGIDGGLRTAFNLHGRTDIVASGRRYGGIPKEKALLVRVVRIELEPITILGHAGSTHHLPQCFIEAAAKRRAGQWHPDAILTNLSTFEAGMDGTAGTWSALYYTPSGKKWLGVTASGGKLDVLELDQGLTDPVGEFIDSDQAIQAAQKNGLQAGKEMMMGLAWMGAKDGAPCWTVGGGFEPAPWPSS